MFKRIMGALMGSQHEKDLKQLLPLVAKINRREPWAASLPAEDYPKKTAEFKQRLTGGETLDDILPEAFALVREAARRVLGERHYDVQLIGGIVLHQGKIMEMKTGEGKTLSSVTAAYLNCLTGKGVHVVTVNDYLAERDAQWMGPVYNYLGVTVGSILANMDNEARKEAYSKDITYGTNNEFGFDYLRDNMRWEKDGRVQKYHHYCIIDEIDSILIDEARTPLIISGPAEDDTAKFNAVNRLIPQFEECEKDPATGDYPEEPEGDFKIEEKAKRVTFTNQGMNKAEELLTRNNLISGSLFVEENFEYIHYITQALKAHYLFHKDVDYVVQEGKVQIVDEFTGRILYGRRYSDGLHQAIEAKERIKVAQRNRTLATITFQNFFRMYDKISGMTGTADTEAKEFGNIYGLQVVVVPTNRPVIRADEDDIIFLNEDDKFNAISREIAAANKRGQPVLVGTISIEKSERLSHALTGLGVKHEVLNAKNHAREALIIAEAGAKGSVTIATNMAGRGTDIKLGGNPEFRARKKSGTEATEEEYRSALKKEMLNWQQEYREVQEAGGLYVLGTERHESRRIDNQLRGRSGRQGDPGKSRFFLSLDDDLMRLFGGENFKSMMSKVGMRDGEPLFHPWINKAIERAQTRVEDRNYEIRKHLLEYDDVLNEQRKFIYTQRDNILTDNALKKRVLSAAEEILDEILDTYYEASSTEEEGTLIGLAEALNENFFYSLDMGPEEIRNSEGDSIKTTILEYLKNDLKGKEEQVGPERLNMFLRVEYLRNIDAKWQDHLENLESLREAVYLRAYGQKNPLLEYKLEGFEIFDKLLEDIRRTIARKIFKIRIENPEASRRAARSGSSNLQTNHHVMGQFAAGGDGGGTVSSGGRRGGGPAQVAGPEKVQIKRTQPKVGRNDPCPCGSGKKFKHCCGR